MSTSRKAFVHLAALASAILANIPSAPAAAAEPAPRETATAKAITPAAARGALFQQLDPKLQSAPDRRATYAGAIAVAPNGKLLAIETSGFPAYYDSEGKLIPEASAEYVFLFDITTRTPVQLQVLVVPHTFPGLAWSKDSRHLFVSGGQDDSVVEFVDDGTHWVTGRTTRLGHTGCLEAGIEVAALHETYTTSPTTRDCGPVAADLTLSPNSKRLLVANIQNDSVSLIDVAAGKVIVEQDLRPGIIDPRRHGESGGSYPRSVAWVSADHAYVASVRDREVVSLRIGRDKIQVTQRLPVQGAPAALLANHEGSRLYVALDTSGQVAVIDTRHNRLIETFSVVAPTSIYDDRKLLSGANSDALVLSPDERTLLVSNGGQNSVAVVRLSNQAMDPKAVAQSARQHHSADPDGDDDKHASQRASATVGLVPTGWYPTGVATTPDGATWFIINGKNPAGPNVAWCTTTDRTFCKPPVDMAIRQLGGNRSTTLLAQNVYITQLEKAGFLTMPAPDGLELARLTKQVAHNNRFDQPEQTEADERLFSFLRNHIKHVVYIMKENRTYDQVLGDLEVGNGDPRLTLFPERLSPNHHAIARNFVTLDNMYVSSEGSMTGAFWTYAGQSTDLLERTDPLSLANGWNRVQGGFPYGNNRNANIAYPTAKERHAADPAYPDEPDILPGTHSVYDVDGPGGEAGTGYLWNGALRAGLAVRGYGAFARVYNVVRPKLELYAIDGKTVSPQSIGAYEDPNWPLPEWVKPVPDFYRVHEWQREFAEFAQKGSAPNLMVMYLWEDHFGHFDTAMYGVNTPDLQMADNDYSIGSLVESVAKSPFGKDTLVIVIEDDTTDGPDHVDAQRTVALIAGPYVKQHAVVSKRYTTVNLVKTIEAVLGIQPSNLNDALAIPMSDIFDPQQETWDYHAIVPNILRSTQLPLPPDAHASVEYPVHSAAYWTKAMAGQDFSYVDRIDPGTFNRALWRGLKGKEPYPVARSGADLRDNRQPLLDHVVSATP